MGPELVQAPNFAREQRGAFFIAEARKARDDFLRCRGRPLTQRDVVEHQARQFVDGVCAHRLNPSATRRTHDRARPGAQPGRGAGRRSAQARQSSSGARRPRCLPSSRAMNKFFGRRRRFGSRRLRAAESRAGAAVERSGAVHALGCRRCGPETITPFPVPAHQSVHDLFDHTAFRDLSSRRCRRCRVPLDGSTQLVHPQFLEKRPRVASSLVPASPNLLGQELRQPLVYVVVHVFELAR